MSMCSFFLSDHHIYLCSIFFRVLITHQYFVFYILYLPHYYSVDLKCGFFELRGEFLYFFSVMEVLYFFITLTVNWQLSLCVYVCGVFYRRIIRFGINLFSSDTCRVKTVSLFLDSIDSVGTNTKLLSQGAYLRALPLVLLIFSYLSFYSYQLDWDSDPFCGLSTVLQLVISAGEINMLNHSSCIFLFLNPYTFKKNVSKRPKVN